MSSQNEQTSNADEFQDPLENYDARTCNDALEQALAEKSVEAIQTTPYASIPPTTPVRDAVQQLADLHIACLLVEQDGKLAGLFSDRDALDKVALEYDELADRPVSEVMTTEPVFVYDTDSSAAVLAVMAVSGYRHVPVLALDHSIVGIASPQRVTEFLSRYFGEE